MQKVKQHFLIFLSLLLVTCLFLSLSFYINNKITQLHQNQYLQESRLIKNQIQHLIEAKQKSIMAITLALAEGIEFDKLINADKQTIIKTQNKLRQFSQNLRKNSDFKNVWIQLIDKNGISKARTWTNKQGDSLVNIRQDIKLLIGQPQPLSSISTGKFTISLKSIVPAYDEKKNLQGFVESITHFNSIEKKLEKLNYHSLVMVDKKYKSQLTKSISKLFIDDYYIANFKPSPIGVSLVTKNGIQSFVKPFDYKLIDNFFISNYLIKDIHQQPMGYYLVFKSINDFEFAAVDKFIGSIQKIVIIIIIVTLVLLLFLHKRKQDIEKQKSYFKQIIDTSSNILVVTNSKDIILANQAFFDFFNQYKNLDEFAKDQKCICNLFIKEDDLLHKKMGELTWIEYLIKHAESYHKVKINYQNKITVFSIAINKMDMDKQNLFTIVLNDITTLETYKDQLELLSRTDSLTQIGNRLDFDERINSEIDRVNRYHSTLSLVMIDIDFFKKINDTYGHDIGDKVLVELSKIIKELLRRTDIFCRYGGEEFMIIMPENTLIEAQLSAERIRQHIEDYQLFPIEKLTISLGVTEIRNKDSIETLIKRVDSALYQSKNEGRNKITSI